MEEYKKGLWSEEEDRILVDYIKIHGHGHWNTLAKKSGLKRCGKSCRLRWMNYLNPGLNRDKFTDQEVDLIVRLHKLLGNRWALIAGRVPGRTDNQVKNYWNTHLSKKLGIVTKKTSKVGFISKTESSKSTESKGADKPSTQIMDSGSSCVADGDDEALDTRTNECTSNVANVAALQNIEGSCVADYKALWTNGYDELISSGLPSLLEFTDKNPVELDWNDL